jgi:hypothetical protein
MDHILTIGSNWYQVVGYPKHHYQTPRGHYLVCLRVLREIEDLQENYSLGAGDGSGVFDFVKKHVLGIIHALSGTRDNYEPAMRELLATIGDRPIQEIYVSRRPLGNTYKSVLNILKKIEGQKEVHDKLYHLFFILNIDGKLYRLEKNEDLQLFPYVESSLPEEIKKVYPVGGAIWDLTPEQQQRYIMDRKLNRNLKVIGPTTFWGGDGELNLNNLLETTRKTIGDHDFFHYDAFSTNCQKFAMDVLRSNKIPITSAVQNFIIQDVTQLAPKWGQKVAGFLTDLKSRLNLIYKGYGIF